MALAPLPCLDIRAASQERIREEVSSEMSIVSLPTKALKALRAVL